MSAAGVLLGPAMVALGRRRRHPPGSIIFFEGDTAGEVLFVVEGAVRLECTVGDRARMVELLVAGESLGEAGVLSGAGRSAIAIAANRVELLAIDSATFTELLAARPELTTELLATISRRLVRTSRRHAELGSTDGLGRVCGRLVELVERFGQPCVDGTAIVAPLSQGDIASWAGLSRETMVKSLATLRHLGWIRTDGRTIRVVDLDAVRRRTGSPS